VENNTVNNTEAYILQMQINILKQQIELEESNYKYALELKKDYSVLIILRENINEHKRQLYALVEKSLGLENKSFA
jgi:hypothetical protein